MKRCLILLLLLISGLAFGQRFTTDRFDVAVKVNQDRTIEVTETIAVRFLEPQRGLIRTIPMRVKGSKGKVYRELTISNAVVEADFGQGWEKVPLSARENRGDWVGRIGDPDITHTGAATYRITYMADNALTDIAADANGKDRTELYWNAIPKGWATAIEASTISVSFPEPPARDVMAQIAMGFVGQGTRRRFGEDPQGRVDVAEIQFASETSVTMPVKRRIEKGAGVTIVVGLPKGTVSAQVGEVTRSIKQPGEERDSTEKIVMPPFAQALPVSLSPLIVLPFVWMYARKRRQELGPLVVKFDAPPGVGPSEAGYVIDSKFESRDVAAGIISLAQKGTLRLIPPAEPGGEMLIELGERKKGRGLTRFEEELFTALSQFGPVFGPSSMRGNFGTAFQALQGQLQKDLAQQGIFHPGSSKIATGCLLWVATLTIAMITLMWSACLSVVMAFVAIFIGSLILRRVPDLPLKGSKIRHELIGLKEFITRAHEKELNYMSRVAPDQALFEKLLPYAIAFGVGQQWAEAFKGIDLHVPEWYGGTSGVSFTDVLFVAWLADLNQFDASVQDAVSYSPPMEFSSSGDGGGWGGGDSGFGGGDSGGGDVGDGGGGGGGDSW